MWYNTLFPFINYGRLNKKKLASFENNIEFQNVFCNFVNLCLDKFYIDGLPDTCNERYFKLSLIFNGMAILAKDPERGFLTLGGSPDCQNLNIYGEWDRVICYGMNGQQFSYKNYMWGSDNTGAEAIICRDNDLFYPMINYIMIWAERLASSMRTIDTTARKLKTPYFIVCDESQKSSVKKILEDIDFNQDSIITNKSTVPDMFQILPTGVREGALQTLWEHYYNLQTELRTYLGISSIPNRAKKERLITDEANADEDLASSNLAYRMHNYESFCETANEFFGLELSVRYEDGSEYVSDEEEQLYDDLGDSSEDVPGEESRDRD